MASLQRVLIIEDSEDVVEAVTLTLQIRWPMAKVISTASGTEGLKLVDEEKPDIVILDLSLKDINGFEVLRGIRAFSHIPVVVLTVRGDETDIVKGLELGANDYIVKPFRQMELLSRVNNQLRQGAEELEDSSLVCGQLRLDLSRHVACFHTRQVKLTPIESTLLATLMRNPGQVIPHSTMATRVWGAYYPNMESSLKVHVRRLRQKLESDPSSPELILTRAGAGYYLANPK